MNPIRPPNYDFTFGAPLGVGPEDCMSLPAYMDPAHRFSVSCWEMSDEELADIVKTRRIYLYAMGAGMMPVQIVTRNPVPAGETTE